MNESPTCKLRFDVVCLFDAYFETLREHGVVRRGFSSGQVVTKCWSPRAHASGPYGSVDDRSYGGGPGMVMSYQPLADAIAAAKSERKDLALQPSKVVVLSPAGTPLTQSWIQDTFNRGGAILVCGRYEGIDQRLIDAEVDEEICLGDFVLSGGEIAAMAIVDACARLVPGVLHSDKSATQESFCDGLLEAPHYTRPEHIGKRSVPAVLMSGDHAQIDQWRRHSSLALTARRRPDLIDKLRLKQLLSNADIEFLDSLEYDKSTP